MSIGNAAYKPKTVATKRGLAKDLRGIVKFSVNTKAVLVFANYVLLGIVVALLVLAMTDLFPQLTTFVGVPGLFLGLLVAATATYRVLSGETYLSVVWKPTAALMAVVPVACSLVMAGAGGAFGDWVGRVLLTSTVALLGLQWGYFVAISLLAAGIAALIVLAQLPVVDGLAWAINMVRSANYAQAYEPSITSSRVVPDTTVKQDDTKDAPEGLVAELAAFGIVGAQEKGVVNGPVVARHLVKLPKGTRVNKLPLTDLARELQVPSIRIINDAGNGLVGFDIPQRERRVVEFKPLLATPEWKRAVNSDMALPACPGVIENGKPYIFDLKAAVHLFIAGTTGAGKSVFANAILMSLMASGADFWLMVADGKDKRGDFAPYYGDSAYLLDKAGVQGLAIKPFDMLAQLHWLVAEMDRRYAGEETDLTPIIWLVDEVADIIAALVASGEKKAADAFDAMLERISQKSRAVNIVMVLCTQSPNSDIFKQTFRANVPSAVGLTTKTAAQSKVAIDDVGCELLLSKGDAYVRLLGEAEKTRVHGAYISKELLETMVR